MNLKEMIGQERIDKGFWWSKNCGLQLVEGCTKVSPGCDNCWSLAAANMRSFQSNPKIASRYNNVLSYGPLPQSTSTEGRRDKHLNWTGQVNPQWQDLGKIGRARKPQVYTFWNDLFHPGVEEEFITSAVLRMLNRPQHFYTICTKRPDRALEYFRMCFTDFCAMDPDYRERFRRLMIVTTAENQAMADLRIPILLQIPGVLHGVSVEPNLGLVDFGQVICSDGDHLGPTLHNHGADAALDWVIAGPETGPRRRPADIAWFNSLLSQCKAAGVPYFQKALEIDGKISKNMDEWPSYIRVREVPDARL